MNSTQETFEKYERKRSPKKAKAYDSAERKGGKQSCKDAHKTARRLKRWSEE